MLRLQGLPHFVSSSQTDPYFKSVYKFLYERPGEQRLDDEALHKFWERYCDVSRRRAFHNAFEAVRRAWKEEVKMMEKFRNVQIACAEGNINSGDLHYDNVMSAHLQSLSTLLECCKACASAAKDCTYSRPCGSAENS